MKLNFLKKISLLEFLLAIFALCFMASVVVDYSIYTDSLTAPAVSDVETGPTLNEKAVQQILDAQKSDITVKHNGKIGKSSPFDPAQ